MLLTKEIYRVSVALNDERMMYCILLSKPTSDILIDVVYLQGQSRDFAVVLAAAKEIKVPALGCVCTTVVKIAGVIVGTIRIDMSFCYKDVPQLDESYH